MMFFGWLWPILMVVGIVAVVLALRDRGRDGDDSGAEQALARRYAAGDIDQQEYRERSVALSASRPGRSGSSSWWPVAAAVGAVGLLVTWLLWAGMGSGWAWNTMGRHLGSTGASQTTGSLSQPYGDATDVTVTARDLVFDPATITVDAGEPVNLTLTNDGRVFHDLTIPDLDLMLDAQPGATVTTGITIDDAGTYDLLCTVPGHADAGMRGTLTAR